MAKQYDVIIIGAGPAGLECANQLKNTGLSILIIEKNKIIGPKTCAGGLTNLGKFFDIPKGKTLSFQRQTVFIKEKSSTINLANPIKTIARLDLGQHQLQKIRHSQTIKVLKETLVKQIKKDVIITSRGSFKFQYLVGADGSNSIVRKFLGLKSKICIGMCYDNSKITNKFIWYVNPTELKSGYIWAFPHKKFTNIGVYFNPTYISSKQANKALEGFLISHKYNFSKSKLKAAPINYQYSGCVFGNLFLIGDAAGLASKATGEGISYALTSGQEIAKKIINPDYQLTELNKILIFKKRQESMFKVFDRLTFMQTILFKTFFNLMKLKWFQVYFGN
jgi:flavin-dependent dehydrogenase